MRKIRRLPRRQRFSGLSFNRMLPNLMTLLGLCIGLSSIRLGLEGRYGTAVLAIAVSGVIDGLDGRLARLLKATSRFGAEFDSLADFLCFGVAPSLLLYMWSLQPWGAIGFLPPLMFTSAMALRLARFNAALDSAPKAAFAYNFFTGVPAPAGAVLALFPLFIGLAAGEHGQLWLLALVSYPLFTAAVLAVTAVLCVSNLPIWSFKNFKIPTAGVLPLLLGVVVFAALTFADPFMAGALAGLAYIVMLPFSLRSYRKLAREAEARRAAAEMEDEEDGQPAV
ncbi:CDP-alcohol phosphatidyltransferase family protein [Acidocella aminolytica]|jgi:CDP-diacylglycerol--serine O-phosphatidyltransferase|uniref:CDP-diacylglycerol--serine O-phosphatidyltransferase n=2 Tax=Acidocella TaxID=50709 RepID=A0A0D6PGX2_9PROT|nr:phosphatidylcholine/phosphatidylserine synthase [Acidocella aminolytica]GAN81020.1 CDP-diacylglycerol--serine O-phosphatidyltransferase [Acidocella aminolytica 101 = DSM 11237]SHE88984.1 CDP-diacylglycerol---serine O-phosphatidyltransferase [Acidocella aminolytica 101 = DSM 11237]